jgi:hypothetical protein
MPWKSVAMFDAYLHRWKLTLDGAPVVTQQLALAGKTSRETRHAESRYCRRGKRGNALTTW